MSVRVSGGDEGGASPRCRTAGIASAAATRTEAAATIHGKRARGTGPSAPAVGACPATSNALLRILLQAPSQVHDERGGHVARDQTPLRLGAHHGRQRIGDVLAGKCPLPRQHLEQHGAERPDVRAAIDGPATRLFRRHIGGGSEDHPCLGVAGRQRRRVQHVGARASRGERFGQPEVEDLDRAVGPKLDVGRFEIAVDHAVLVSGFERVGNLLRDEQHFVQRNRAAGKPL
jgi:hypothetical protein